jgi:hypothetical protein
LVLILKYHGDRCAGGADRDSAPAHRVRQLRALAHPHQGLNCRVGFNARVGLNRRVGLNHRICAQAELGTDANYMYHLCFVKPASC